MTKRKEFTEEKERLKAEEEAEFIAEQKEVSVRIKKLGVSEKELRKALSDSQNRIVKRLGSSAGLYNWIDYKNKILTVSDVEKYQNVMKEAEHERNLKIKEGNQYICSDKYDSWILKYNGYRVTFGDVNFKQHTFYNYYIQYEGDKNPLFIDKSKGIVKFNGNISRCKPR